MTRVFAVGISILSLLFGTLPQQPKVVQLRYLVVNDGAQHGGQAMHISTEALRRAAKDYFHEGQVDFVSTKMRDTAVACHRPIPAKALACDLAQIMRKDTVTVGVRRTMFFVHISQLNDPDGEHWEDPPLPHYTCDDPEGDAMTDCVTIAANELAKALSTHFHNPNFGHASAK